MAASRPVLVVAGLGNSTGAGASVARLFAKKNYAVALLARGEETVKKLTDEINQAGGQASGFPLSSYAPAVIRSTFDSIRSTFPSPEYTIRVAVFNTGHLVWKSFLDTTEEDIEQSVDVNIKAAFAFSREAITTFLKNEIGENGARGSLIFTGATASIRGIKTTSAFAAGKFGKRALSQSLAKEFGKENIHVSHVIIDGSIPTDRVKGFLREQGREWSPNPDTTFSPDSIAESYLYLVNQDRTAWTWELDLRPAHETW